MIYCDISYSILQDPSNPSQANIHYPVDDAPTRRGINVGFLIQARPGTSS